MTSVMTEVAAVPGVSRVPALGPRAERGWVHVPRSRYSGTSGPACRARVGARVRCRVLRTKHTQLVTQGEVFGLQRCFGFEERRYESEKRQMNSRMIPLPVETA